jgi:hypothetical protein
VAGGEHARFVRIESEMKKNQIYAGLVVLTLMIVTINQWMPNGVPTTV